MATVSSTSAIDVNSIVSSLMSVEQRPLTLITNQKTAYEAKLTAYGTLKSALSTFQTSVSALAAASKFNAQSATSATPSMFTATANGSATIGDYAITVNQLAKSQKIALDGVANTTDVIGTGKLTIAFGTYAPEIVSPATPASFTANPNKTSFDVTIDASNNTLAGVRDAINAANGGVTATIVNDGTANRLVITSKETGEVNSLKITVADDDGNPTDNTGLSRLAYDPLSTAGAGKNMSQLQAPLNALLNIDGIDVVKASNSVSDAIEGITLNLLGTSNSQPVNLAVASDQAKIKESVTAFVDAYNKLNDTLRTLTKYDETGKSSGKLLGDATARNITAQIKSVVTKVVDTGGTITSLTDIGVSFQRDGKLALDSTKLTDAISNHFDDIAALFSTSARTSDAQVSYLGSTSKTQSGTYPITVSQLGSDNTNMLGMINGVAGTGLNQELIGAAGDVSEGLRIKVTGGSTGARGTVTFVKGYAAQLDDILDGLLDDEGLLAARTDGITASVKRLEQQTDAFNLKMTVIEKRYRDQYTRLDTLLSSMQNTSSYLSQQISALGNN
ncbi:MULTISPECIES: flagellar filament capping protein FliD [unclassified Methylotenera]|uniref:flagellar filament capping protein FliD n=1 Tax=unclassified Methylotenera TaxID=2643294 RepID=UPI0003769DE4|nr:MULTISPECIES: flagellar filament capping protein FliD [unclassified Methylotenera]